MELKLPIDSQAVINLYNASANFVAEFNSIRELFIGNEGSESGNETDNTDVVNAKKEM